MDTIQKEIDSVLEENNIAQEQFEDVLEMKNVSVTELVIPTALHGELNLEVLAEKGFNNITSITFEEGELTSIQNIPETLQTLVCPRNLLTSIDGLPNSLTHLDITSNYIDDIDLLSVPLLTHLYADDNKLSQLVPLPKTLIHLQVANNDIKELDFNGVTKVAYVNVSNNPITLIENMPASVTEFLSENTSSIRFENSALPETSGDSLGKDKITFDEAFTEYYSLKSKYETSRKDKVSDIYDQYRNKKEARQKINAYLHPCIKCERSVNTLFYTEDNHLYAKCGSETEPCSLNIDLQLAGNTNLVSEITELTDALEVSKSDIIRTKLDSLFNYTDDEESKELFEKELEDFNEISEYLNEVKDVYNHIHHNEITQINLEKKQKEMQRLIHGIQLHTKEYQETEDVGHLQMVVDTYKKNLLPLVLEIRKLTYPEQEIITHRVPIDMPGLTYRGETYEELKQYNADFPSLDALFIKGRSVESFEV